MIQVSSSWIVFDISISNEYTAPKFVSFTRRCFMKSVSIRMPEEVLDWLREMAAKETIARKRQYSINSLVLDIIKREMEIGEKKGG
jgi:isocitrate dehydrogenase kinase/phosphatase